MERLNSLLFLFFTKKKSMLCEKKHWVGVYADEFSHMRNRTSNRAEGAHSAINVALGNIPSGKISTVTDTIDRWYILKVRSIIFHRYIIIKYLLKIFCVEGWT